MPSNWQSPLPPNHRHITTHDPDGQSIYSSALPSLLDPFPVDLGNGATSGFELAYTTASTPAPLAHDQDLTTYTQAYSTREGDGLVRKGGSVLRYVDLAPGTRAPMHRTVSLDYGICVAGEVECVLDSGEARTLRAGDVMVQRGTNHAWVNRGPGWARVVFVLLDSTPVVVGGRKLGEDVGGMHLNASH